MPCAENCYVHSFTRWKRNVKEAYAHNLPIWRDDPELVCRALELACDVTGSDVTRMLVSADVTTLDQASAIRGFAKRRPGVTILGFTKNRDPKVMEELVSEKNLSFRFSPWPGWHDYAEVPDGYRAWLSTDAARPANAVQCPQDHNKKLTCRACRVCDRTLGKRDVYFEEKKVASKEALCTNPS